MKVLLTGASGYLGAEILAELLERENVEILAWGRDRRRLEILRRRFASAASRVTVRAQDLLEPFSEVADLDAVIHTAALRPPTASGNPEGMRETNLEGTHRVAQLASRAGCRRFSYLSSQSVYGTDGAPWTESAPLRPETAYARSKRDGEAEIMRMLPQVGVSILRLSRLYGVSPSVRWSELPGRFARTVCRGEPLSIHGSGEQRFDLIHIRDAAAAVVQATLASGEMESRVFNVGGGKSVSLNELGEAFASLALDYGLPAVAVRRIPDHPRSAMRHLELDITRIEQELGWHPRTSVLEGLRGYITAALENADPP